MEASLQQKKIVCLGGGIGTLNLIKGLRDYSTDIAIVVSMADDGGSAGRLRRLYNMLPPGDLISCMSALSDDQSSIISQLLTYRFPGERYGKDDELAGHKLGNLIMVALRDITGSFPSAIDAFQKLFKINGHFLPATLEPVEISIITKDGTEIHGEEVIDLGKFNWESGIDKLVLHPSSVTTPPQVEKHILEADYIIIGPGDLYTNILSVLIVPGIKEALSKSTAKKIFIVNVANKPNETHGYFVENYLLAIEKHIGILPFDQIIVNNNHTFIIPEKYNYTYVKLEDPNYLAGKVIQEDLVDESFPIYHNSEKLARTIVKHL